MKRATRFGLIAIGIAAAISAAAMIGLNSAPPLEPYAALALPSSAGNTGGLRAQFFGVSTVLLSDGESSVMVDGFFTRPGWMTLLLGKLSPDEARINAALARGKVSKVDALLVAHSHHDHAMDSASVAAKTGALLVGSGSTANIARGQALSESRIRVVKGGDELSAGKFEIRFFETPHSPKPVSPGTMDEPLHLPAKLSDYKLGKNYSFLLRHPQGNILVVPSANFIPSLFKDVKADVVFLGIGILGKQSDEFIRTYWKEVVQATGAKLVIPIHWDDFGRSLDEPIRPLPYFMDNMTHAMEVLQDLARADGVSIRLMPLFSPVDLPR